jgi:hypothetical protein
MDSCANIKTLNGNTNSQPRRITSTVQVSFYSKIVEDKFSLMQQTLEHSRAEGAYLVKNAIRR